MRIAYLINQYPAVSHTFIRREIHALERQGLEIMRISIRGWDRELVDPEDFNERKRTCYVLAAGKLLILFSALRVLAMRPIRFAKAFWLACRMGWRAERPLPVHLAYLMEACHIFFWLRAANIQHVHAHFGTNSAEVAMLVHVLGGPRWSFTVHGPKEFEKPEFIGLAEKIRRCTFVVAVSSFGRSQLYRFVEHQQWPKVRVVHCGLEPGQFTDSSVFPTRSRRLVCVGRLCEQKGQLLLVEAVSQLVAKVVDFELVLAGDGELRAEIETLIARKGLNNRVRVTGWITGAEVRDEIRAARALVLPSFAEGLPVVLMEAMALRRPVISTYVGGIPELVCPGKNGWLVPAGDADALTHAIQACLETSAETLTELGEGAFKYVRARHNVDTEAIKFVQLFERNETVSH